ncbi:MAG: glycosyl hydrolase family 28 protein [Prevotella sp.]|nr:glycosyl hydrolase family 28 protein [Prevotella sp.]
MKDSYVRLWHTAIALLVLIFICHDSNAETSCVSDDIPCVANVGTAVMPADIAPLGKLPFKMKEIKRPVFKSKTIYLTESDRDLEGMITMSVNAKIAELSKQGGGTVVVPAGHWKSGRIILKSGVELRIAKNAILEFSERQADYLPVVFTRHEGVEVMGAGAFIYAYKQKNIALTGEGVITGPDMDVDMRRLPNGKSVVEKDIDWKMPVSKRLCDGQEGRTFYRPKSFSPIECKNVLVEGVTFEKSVLWNINPIYCDNVIIRGVTVNSVGVPSGDGIDISSCKNVLIEYSTLNCGDDCFTLKAGRCEDGLRVNKSTENVVIRYCLAKDGHGGITCGSETAGGIRNVYLHDCVFYGTRTGFRFKTRRNRGGAIENIIYERVRLVDMKEAFTWDLLGSKMYMGDLARRNPPLDITPLTPIVRNITIRNFIVESSDRMMTVNALPEIPCTGIIIENGKVRTNRIVRTINDADGITFKNLEIQATDNRIVLDNSRNVNFENVSFYVPGEKPEIININN